MKDSVQEQLISARRAQILDAASRVFAEKGFHTTTIKDIAREAGIADGTIYNYFENKTALLLGIVERMRDSLQITPEDMPPLDQLDLHAFIRGYLYHPLMTLRQDNFELFRVVMSEIMVNAELRTRYQQNVIQPTLALAEPLFQHWMDQGVIRPMNVRLMLRAISGMVTGLILEYIMDESSVAGHWDELPDFLTALILNGIRNDHS